MMREKTRGASSACLTFLPKLLGVMSCALAVLLGCATTRARWRRAESAGTLTAYQDFLDRYPDTGLADSARLRMERLCYAHAESVNTIDCYREFLGRYKDGKHAAMAQHAIEELNWGRSRAENTADSYGEFLRQHPTGVHTADAKRGIEGLDWNVARRQNSTSACDSFLRRHPDGFFAQEAVRYKDSLIAEVWRGRLAGLFPRAKSIPSGYSTARVVRRSESGLEATLTGDVLRLFPDVSAQCKTDLERQRFLRSRVADSLRAVTSARRAELVQEAYAVKIPIGAFARDSGVPFPLYDTERSAFCWTVRTLDCIYQSGAYGTASLRPREELAALEREAKHVIAGFWFDGLPLKDGVDFIGFVQQEIALGISDEEQALSIERNRLNMEAWIGFRLSGRIRNGYPEARQPVIMLVDRTVGDVVWTSR